VNAKAHAFLLIVLIAGSIFSGKLAVSADNAEHNERIELVAPLGLPSIPAKYARVSAAKVELGRKLFFDRRLSFNNTLSCAMCHLVDDAFASTQSRRAIGMEGRTLRRNAPSLLNVVYQRSFFHDGRETHLDLQVWMPFLAADEMANPSMGYVLDRIGELDDYAQRFERIYPDQGISILSVADAIATYEATLVSGNSRFDRWYFGKEKDALTESEKSGFQIFTGKGGCSSCHTIDGDTALFTDHQFHNTGIGYRASMHSDQMYVIPLAPGVETRMSLQTIDTFGEKLQNDVGRFEVTHVESDRWAYKTPSLRNVSRTRPYMHDGSIATLEDVVEYYGTGTAGRNVGSGALTHIDLSADEKADLVAFLKSLDGDDRARP